MTSPREQLESILELIGEITAHAVKAKERHLAAGGAVGLAPVMASWVIDRMAKLTTEVRTLDWQTRPTEGGKRRTDERPEGFPREVCGASVVVPAAAPDRTFTCDLWRGHEGPHRPG